MFLKDTSVFDKQGHAVKVTNVLIMDVFKITYG